MSQCMCCLSQAGAFSLTCSHFICRQCFDVVKLGNSVFCTVCCHMSDVQVDSTGNGSVPLVDSANEIAWPWQKEKAKKISPISVTDDRSIASDVVSIPSTSSKDPPLVAGPIHNIPSIDKKVPPKFGQHRPPPDHFWCSLLLSKTPRRIFVRIHDEELERFNLMSAKMQEVYQSMSNVSREAKHLKIGNYYSIKRRGTWYRAVIFKNVLWVGVTLIDVGDEYYVHGESFLTVQPLNPEFQELPAQAVNCDLDTPPKCHGHSKSECTGLARNCWNSKCIKFIDEKRNSTGLCLIDKSANEHRSGKEDRLYVTMYVGNDEVSLNQQVIENLWSRRKPTAACIAHFKAFDALRKEILVKDSRKQVKQTWLFTSASDALPREFEGLVTWVDNKGGIYIHTSDWSSKLIYMRDRLKETFSSDDHIAGSLQAGDCCFVKYKGNWFRAVLDEFNGRERATVFFVDYGAVEQVSVKDIRLKNMFFKIPVQTFRCHLEGIEPASERNTKSRNYTESALNLLHELTVNNEFNITVENFSPLRVSLKFLDNDVKVSSLLVAARKAKYRERGQAPTPTDLKAQ